VIEAAQEVRRVLDRAGAASLCKTSGKRGLHVVVPLGAAYDHDQARQFAELIAALVHPVLPDTTSLERSPSRRKNRVYLDYLQNRRGQTLAAPYCVRPAPGATVSTPLKWAEVGRRLDPTRFTIKTLARRLDRDGDLWAAVLGPGVDLATCLTRLARDADR
jgi:bifunctional non-homologous end joining protein LigD